MSVPSPTLILLPPAPAVGVVAEDFFPPPPQPAATRSARTPRSASDLFIPDLSAKVCDYGAKTVSEPTTRHPTPAHVTIAVVLQVRHGALQARSEEHTSELQSPCNLVCRLLLEKKKNRARAYGRGAA